MKRITLLVTLFFLVNEVTSQTLNQSANFPNANWTLSGTYTAAGLQLNPTTSDSQFRFNDNAVNSGNDNNDIMLTSPIINLKPAFDAGETGVTISFQVAYRLVGSQVLKVEWYNADTATWGQFPGDSSAPENDDATNAYKTCTFGSESDAEITFSISGFTTNQLQNFMYRFVFDDNDEAAWGFCLSSPTIMSFTCSPPTNLGVMNIGNHSVDLTWTAGSNSGNSEWIIEWGTQGFSLGSGTEIENVNNTQYFLQGLTPGVSYDFYVREDCSDGQGTLLSSWAGPYTFSTNVLSLDEYKIEGFNFSPNPVTNELKLNSQKMIESIVFYNIVGQKVLERTVNKTDISVEMQSLRKGIYFLKVKVEDEIGMYRIIKE